VTTILSKPYVIPEGDTAILAPLLIELLIGCSLMLLAAWASETLHASAHHGLRKLLEKQADWTRMRHLLEPVAKGRLGHDTDGLTFGAETAP
jgi:hypothetical protein